MKKYLIPWFFTLIILIIVDLVWHSLLFSDAYQSGMNGLVHIVNNRIVSSGISYIFYLQIIFSGLLTYFALRHLDQSYKAIDGLLTAVALTFIAYGHHSLINGSLIYNYDQTTMWLDVARSFVEGIIAGVFLIFYHERFVKGKD